MSKLFVRSYFVASCCLISATLTAQPVQSVKYLNTITSLPSSTTTLIDNYNYAAYGTFHDASVNGYLRFNVEEELNAYYGTNKNYRIEVEIQKYSTTAVGTTDGSPITIQLSVRINPSNTDVYKDYDEYIIPDCHKFKYKIKTIWAWTCSPDPCSPVTGDKVTSGWSSLPASLNLIGGIEMERYNDFDPEDTPPIVVEYDNSSSSPTYKHMVISDFFIDGAWAYDIEWTYSNNYGAAGTSLSLSDVEYSFHNNSTRIRVYKEFPIEIPAIFDQGYLIVRVRGIGKQLVGSDLVDEYGDWSLLDNYDAYEYAKRNLYGVNPDYYVKIDPSVTPDIHEKSKNWMFQTSFAEEGKMKNVITYYDGTLRSRQTVTQSPYRSDKEVIITETFYDHVGRPAVQSLPSPHNESVPTSYVKEMKYYTDFNQVKLDATTWDKFDKKYFERDDISGCTPYVLPFDEISGVANYYSASNGDQGGSFAFIPDANGYPYTLTEYTNDNTGRVSRQTGLGPDHILESGHETRYLYGVPEQEELDRVFGNNAGNSNHYQKNLVVDPNGQVSVSYLDMKGNVIATALAGAPTNNLAALKSEIDGTGTDLYESMATELTINALGAPSDAYPFGAFNWLSEDGKSLTVSRTFLVTDDNTDYEFEYTLADIDYITDCMHEQCYDCVYDLTLSLIGDCGEELLNEGEGIILTIGDVPLEDGSGTSTSCDNYEENWTETITLDIGSYQLIKTLTLNEASINTYADLYIAQLESSEDPDCITPFSEFEAEAALNINYLEICSDFDCQICQDINSAEEFSEHYPELVTEYDFSEEVIENLYNQFRLSCSSLCESVGVDWCEAGYKMMLADMRPDGQYGICRDEVTGEIEETVDYLSIFNPANQLQHRSFTGGDDPADWQHPIIYFDSDPDGVGEFEEGWNMGYANTENERATIEIEEISEDVYDPPVAVDYLDDVITEDGKFFIYPEGLANVTDFIVYYNAHPEWASSLIAYHPEFYYYSYCSGIKTCTDNIIVVADPETTESMNTYQFDQFLLGFTSDEDFEKLIDLGLINFGNSFDEQLDAILDMDPLFSGGTSSCSPDISGTDYDILKSSLHAALNAQHCEVAEPGDDVIFTIWQAIYFQFDYEDPTPGTMYDCPDEDDLDVTNLHDLFLGGDEGAIERWKTFANIYISTKQQYIREQMNFFAGTYAMDLPDAANSYGNYCIGEDEYTYPTFFDPSDFMVLIDESLTCNIIRGPLLQNKTPRFGDPLNSAGLDTDMDEDPSGAMTELSSEGAYSYWYETGNGAISLDILNFLNGMILYNDFYETSYNLVPPVVADFPLSSNLYYAIYNTHSPHIDNLVTEVDGGDPFTLAFHDDGASFGTDDILILEIKDEGGLYDSWAHLNDEGSYQFLDFDNLKVTSSTTFTIDLNVMSISDNIIHTVNIDATTQLPINDVTSFGYTAITCENSPILNTLGLTMQYLLGGEHFFDASYTIEDDEVNDAISINMSTYLGDGPYDWENVTSPARSFKLSGSASYVYITFYRDRYPATSDEDGIDDDATFIDNFSALYPGGIWNIGKVNDFTATYYVGATAYSTIGDLIWYNQFSERLEGLPAGSCDFPIETPCTSEENFNSVDLQKFFDAMADGDHLVSDDYDLSASSFVTPRLEQLFGKVTGEETLEWNIISNDGHHMVAEFVTNESSTCTVELNLSADGGTTFTSLDGFDNLQADLSYAAGDISYTFTISGFVGASEYFISGYTTCVPLKNCNCNEVPNDNDIDDEQLLIDITAHFNLGDDPDYIVTTSESDYEERDCNTSRDYLEGGITIMHNGYGYGYAYYDWYPYTISADDQEEIFPLWVVKNHYAIPEDPGYVLYALSGDCDEYWDGDSWENDTEHGRSVLARINDVNLYDPEPCRPDELTFPDPGDPYLCADMIADMVQFEAEKAYNDYIEDLKNQFKSEYAAHCINSLLASENTEDLAYTYTNSEYHYTLYYYDLGSNLAMTVPPIGVDFLSAGEIEDVAASRATTTPADDIFPEHTFKTHYHYNSLNQLIFQETPDAGVSRFWYDQLGRLVLSQNSEQNKTYEDIYEAEFEKYSFTKFDKLGRIIQVGEIWSGPNEEDETTFYDDINDMTNFPDNIDDYRYSVTESFYNTAYAFGTSPFGTSGQENLRNRIAYTTIEENYDADDDTYDYATHYSYDIHGNVKSLVQENPSLDDLDNRFKKINYSYDLISGNVNQVDYQPDKIDRFSQRYYYDDVNRLRQVESSIDDRIWERDARYTYYRHGPVAREEVGDLMVQGIDYAYTIHGWLKGVNAGALNTGKDMGNDGKPKTPALNTNQRIASDAFGFILDYYNGDYTQISSTTSFIPDMGAIVGGSFVYYDYYTIASCPDLFNGNIRAMSTALMETDRTKADVLGKTYQYDQLNRLMNSYSFIKSGMHVSGSFSWASISADNNNRWGTNYKYDGNGNILEMQRSGSTGTAPVGGVRQFDMDKMTYNYYANSPSSDEGSNQLSRVDDAIGDGAYSLIDIDDQSSSTNYEYDNIGNLISDEKEYIDNISWTVYGKIKSIDKASGHGSDLEFAYDPNGNRIMKKATDGTDITYTYYIRDAQGNVMATYERLYDGTDDDIYLNEQHLYGSSRLGYRSIHIDVGTGATDPDPDALYFSRYLGNKRYELTNHLGNVLEVITDRRFQIQETATGYTTTVKYYEPDVVAAQDYDPFGMLNPGRNWSSGTEYRYGFNGKENDDEIAGNNNDLDFGARVYDSRLAHFFSVDSKTNEYAWQTPYAYFSNSPINIIDFNGEGAETENSALLTPSPNRLKFPFSLLRVNPWWWGKQGKGKMQSFFCDCGISCNIYAKQRKPFGINFGIQTVTKYRVRTITIEKVKAPDVVDRPTIRNVVLDPSNNYKVNYHHHGLPDRTVVTDGAGGTIGDSGMTQGDGTIPVSGQPNITITVTPGPLNPTAYKFEVEQMPNVVTKIEVKKLFGFIPFNLDRSKQKYDPDKNYDKSKEKSSRTINIF